jgi:hypothetical protein
MRMKKFSCSARSGTSTCDQPKPFLKPLAGLAASSKLLKNGPPSRIIPVAMGILIAKRETEANAAEGRESNRHKSVGVRRQSASKLRMHGARYAAAVGLRRR